MRVAPQYRILWRQMSAPLTHVTHSDDRPKSHSFREAFNISAALKRCFIYPFYPSDEVVMNGILVDAGSIKFIRNVV